MRHLQGGAAGSARSKRDWPFFAAVLARWYDRRQRDLPWRNTRDPYAIWVSEVMLQQTQVQTVIPYYHRFMALFPNVQALAAAEEQRVLKAWEGLGYYSRARNLHRAARAVCAAGGVIPGDLSALCSLPGIGAYTAAAVLSIAFAKPHAAVDGNVKRVLGRLLLLEAPADTAAGQGCFQEAADRLLARADPGRHNQALMELGATVCTPRRPRCTQCPLAAHCRARLIGAVGHYPRRSARRALGEQLWAAAVICRRGRLLLVQRPAAGLLGGLWEFPSFAAPPGQDPARACRKFARSALGMAVQVQRHAGCVRHAYSHFKLRLEVYWCEWQKGRVRLEGRAAFKWLRPGEIEDLPLHRAAQKVLPLLSETEISFPA